MGYHEVLSSDIPYSEIASDLNNYHEWAKSLPDLFEGFLRGKVVSKGRARVSAKGHVYTPAETRAFESKVFSWASNLYLGRAVFCPVAVYIKIYDTSADPFRLAGLTSNQHGDIDNKAKAVLDACNRVLWRDDKQINKLEITRCYGADEGFAMRVRRNGLSRSELDNLRKHKKATQ